MRNGIFIAALMAGVALAACNVNKPDDNEANAALAAEPATGHSTAIAATDWPEGTRIVEENHVYYRVEPSGTRVRLEPGDSTIVVDNGIRYRVDPGGTPVRIDDQGLAVRVAPGGVDATIPVGANAAVTVNTQ